MTDLKTPETWMTELGIEILDPDGWRSPTAKDWDEPITRAEFEERAATCTQRHVNPTPSIATCKCPTGNGTCQHGTRTNPTPTEASLPRRRHQLNLKLEADTIDDLESALMNIGLQLVLDDARGRDWNEPVQITSGGYNSSHQLTMHSNTAITGDAYRARLKDWADANRAARRAARS